MKKTALNIKFCFLFIVCFCFSNCKKNNNGLNLILYDKPLSVIQKYIQGKWRLEYTYGGLIANLRTDFHDKDYIWQIDSSSHIEQWYMGYSITDTTIEWSQYTYGNGTKVFVMNFYDKRMYPYLYNVWSIVDDSLVLKDFGSDPMTYHFSKQK